MGMCVRWNLGFLVFIYALSTRLAGVVITTFTDLNTYARGDVTGYAAAAEYTAAGLREGTYQLSPELSATYNWWAPFIAPFYLLPGPSRIYARIAVAIAGAYVVYNVYIITRNFASKKAGLIAVVPLICYPSFIFIHSTVLREVGILLGLTTAARLFIVPPDRLPDSIIYFAGGAFLWMSVYLRPENAPVILLLVIVTLILKYRDYYNTPVVWGGVCVGGIITAILARSFIQSTIDQLAYLRRIRGRGRTEVLGGVIPETVFAFASFSWIAAGIFLFAPFPWQVDGFPDMIVLFEGLGNILFFVFAIYGFKISIHKSLTTGIVLASGLILGSILYGIATPNIGTAIRFRQMVLWVLFIFGGIGFSNKIKLNYR